MESNGPLSVRNGPSSIPKPVSRLPLPGSLRKRQAVEALFPEEPEIQGKENETLAPPASKRPKIAAAKTAGSTAVAKKPAGVRAGGTTANGAKKPGIARTTTAAKKAATSGLGAKKPATAGVKRLGGTTTVAKTTVVAKSSTGAPSKPAMASKGGANAPSKPVAKETAGGKQKRCAWDLKGRLQDVEAQRNESRKNMQEMQQEMEQFRQEMSNLKCQHSEQSSTLQMKQQETSAASERIKSLEQELVSERGRFSAQAQRLASLQLEHATLQSLYASVEQNLAAARAALTQLTTDMSTIQCRHDALKITKDEAMAESAHKSELIASLEAAVQRHLETMAEFETRRREDETTRRKLHNVIQELKGNIRVFCRVRPLLPGEPGDGGRSSCMSQGSSSKGVATEPRLDVSFPDSDNDSKQIALESNSDQPTCTGGAASAKSYTFEFDRVFGPASTQQSVFGEISQLVQSALDGYNVCIFAYGQTGSGKTYTMEGPGRRPRPSLGEEEEGEGGMIPRAVEQVFASAHSLKEQGWEYHMQASFLEIYNETLRDLLTSSSSSAPGGHSKQPLQHDIKLDSSLPGGVYVTNVTPTPVHSQSQVATLLQQAGRNRAVAATNCNERSSRSHSVFRLEIKGCNGITGEQCKGSLNLVDLAGSERLAQSGSVGDRLKETKNINKSLSNLGQVIMALANKDQHIPYRNSKLTYLLQNSLGGNSKTLMFVNMSPQAASLQETLCSLRFATKVNQCNIGTARKSNKQ